jgi:cell division septation protein DedD
VVQVGAFSSAEGASRLTNELRQKGHAAITITGSDYHRVVVGPFPSEADATNVQSELQQQGYAGYVRPNPATE